MVRVNPLHAGTPDELDAVLAQGADWVMLPMFQTPDELQAFSRIVAGRAPIVALLETAGALQSLDDWVDTPGLCEVFVGLNDLHLSLGCRFMFEPLGQGILDQIAATVHARGLRFGFGGIARLDEGLLPGRDVLGEHLRLGSSSVILSRTFRSSEGVAVFEDEIATMRAVEELLKRRVPAQIKQDALRVAAVIEAIAVRQARAA
jgi:hypothetical protein